MSKKYLSLEEAAQLLGIRTEELMRLREKGDIRGFADRGNWKFKEEDVQDLARQRQVDSDPEVPIFNPGKSQQDSGLILDDEDEIDFNSSDSDVKLAGGKDFSADELDLVLGDDSDVKLTGLDSESDVRLEPPLKTDPELAALGDPSGSDSDVKLIGSDSDSDVKLIPGGDSDSDVQLIDNEATVTEFSMVDEPGGEAGDDSDSDVSLLPGKAEAASVLADDNDLPLPGGSSVLLGGSGILLDADDSGMKLGGGDEDEGITLALDDDSGISLSSGDSGISLEAADSGISLDSIGDSGISLDAPDDFSGTVPMMNAVKDVEATDTQFEIPSLSDDSAYELASDGLEDTRTLELSQVGDEGGLDDAVFEVDDTEGYDDSANAFEDPDELDLDAGAFEEEEEFVEVDGDVFDTVEDGPKFGGPVRAAAPAETEWGLLEFSFLTIASLFMIACGIVLTDLVKNTATASDPNPISSTILDTLGGLYK